MTTLADFKTQFDLLFIPHLEEKLHERFFACGADARSHRHIEHVLLLAQGGKRIRPYVAALAFESAEPRIPANIIPLLFSLELFHLFAIIHDDIVDDSPVRHGIQSFHVLFGKEQAIIWGDYIMSLAYEAIMSEACSFETRTLFTLMAQETMIGQLLDIAGPEDEFSADAFLDHVIQLKTSRYTFIYPMLLGRSLAGAAKPEPHSIPLGVALGRAFQRLDDLSDILCQDADSGKKSCRDVETGKSTHISNFIRIRGTPETRMRFETFMARSLTRADIETIRGLAWATGAVEHEKESIRKDFVEAVRIVREMKIKKHHRDLWLLLIDTLALKLSGM